MCFNMAPRREPTFSHLIGTTQSLPDATLTIFCSSVGIRLTILKHTGEYCPHKRPIIAGYWITGLTLQASMCFNMMTLCRQDSNLQVAFISTGPHWGPMFTSFHHYGSSESLLPSMRKVNYSFTIYKHTSKHRRCIATPPRTVPSNHIFSGWYGVSSTVCLYMVSVSVNRLRFLISASTAAHCWRTLLWWLDSQQFDDDTVDYCA